MLVPKLPGRDCRITNLLMDKLQIPRLTDAEAIHRPDFHVRDHLRRRDDDGLNVLIRIRAAGGKPVPDPKIVCAAGKRHRGLDRLARCLLFIERDLKRRGMYTNFDVLVFLCNRDALAVEI